MSLTTTDAAAIPLSASTTDGTDAPINQPSRHHPDSILKVAKFDEIFIKSDSKKIMDKNRPLLWISHPTTFTSRGYHALLDDHDSIMAMAIYAVFMQLVKLSVQSEPYGILQHSNGKSFSIGFMARTVGIDRELIEKSIDVLTKINWLLSIPPASGQHRDDIPPPSRLQTDNTDDTDDTDDTDTALSDESDESDLFDQFWDTYAKKDGRKKSELAFRKSVKVVAKADKITARDAALLIIDRARLYAKFHFRNNRYQKNPLTWLNGEHWNDELITRNEDDDSRPGAVEWLTLLEIVPHISVQRPYKQELRKRIGEKATDLACKIGIPKIQDANSFQRQELRKTFEQGMSK